MTDAKMNEEFKRLRKEIKLVTTRSTALRGMIKLAAKNKYAAYFMGWVHEYGKYKQKKDMVKAYGYFHVSAGLGLVQAIASLAECYLHGLGCDKDEKTGLTFLCEAKDFKHPWAMLEWADRELANADSTNDGIDAALKIYSEVITMDNPKDKFLVSFLEFHDFKKLADRKMNKYIKQRTKERLLKKKRDSDLSSSSSITLKKKSRNKKK